ncbi:MAG: CDP-alcohol phosphatidyltransferase family protein [Burkholderiales bacterium]
MTAPQLLPRPPRRAAYLVPNMFTTGVLFAGFFACVQAVSERFELAAIAILVAMVLDGLDGRVARMTGTQTAFGAEYDSLADMVAFGAAPALVMFEWALGGTGVAGWIAAFVYCAGAALRLARFNTTIGTIDKRYFQGLPSPAAAALLATFVLAATEHDVAGPNLAWIASALAVFAGGTMVSNVLFFSGKDINVRSRWSLVAAVFFIGLAVMFASHLASIVFTMTFAYVMSGYLFAVVRRLAPQGDSS